MHINTASALRPVARTWAPFMVINPDETVVAAMARHRRDTGHVGSVIVVGINPGSRQRLAAQR
jgi:hypothetical protein